MDKMRKKSKENIGRSPRFVRFANKAGWRGVVGIGFVLMAVFFQTGLGAVSGATEIDGTIRVLDREGILKSDRSGVVVFLDDLENPPEENPAPSGRVSVRQAGKQFLPKVLPIMAGTTVDFPNEDTVFHNVFSLSKTKLFDLGIYPQGASKSVTFEKTGLVKIYCNIHPDMVAHILVLANRHFTMTDKNGGFVLTDVPLGAATVRTWYPKSRENPQYKIRTTNAGIHNLDMTIIESLQLQIREETISVQHKNKWGQDYPAKY